MDLFFTFQFFAGCGLVLVPFALLAGVTEGALRAMIPTGKPTP